VGLDHQLLIKGGQDYDDQHLSRVESTSLFEKDDDSSSKGSKSSREIVIFDCDQLSYYVYFNFTTFVMNLTCRCSPSFWSTVARTPSYLCVPCAKHPNKLLIRFSPNLQRHLKKCLEPTLNQPQSVLCVLFIPSLSLSTIATCLQRSRMSKGSSQLWI